MVQPLGEFEFNTACLLGTGSFAVVYGGNHSVKKDQKVAVKIIMKKNLAKSPSSLEKEIKILKELTKLKHENVVCLYDCKETQHNVYLIMEYCNGGELGEYLKKKGCLSEDTIRLFFRQMANAINVLHENKIIHRDLKPPNILLCHNSPNRDPSPHEITLKIADFGFARFLQEGVMATTLCGSPIFMAPEVIMSLKYDAKADLWSIGTIIYLCLTNKAPFSATTPQALKQYYEDNPKLQPKIPIETSPELKDLLCGLLRYDAKDRMEFDEFFNHPFLKQTPKRLALKNQKTNNSNNNNSKECGRYELTSTNPHQNPSSFGTQSPSNYGSPNDVYTGGNLMGNLINKSTNEDDELEEDFVIVESPNDKMGASKESPNGGYYLSKLQDKENLIRAENLKQLKQINEKAPSSSGRQPHHTSHHMTMKRESPPQPIPVPSQREAFEKMKRSYNLKTSRGDDESGTTDNYFDENKENNESNSSDSPINSGNFNSTSSNKFMTDITQMSPPTVQFMCVGTPPHSSAFKQQMSNSRRRCSGPITMCGSPTAGSNTQLNYLNNDLNSPGYQQDPRFTHNPDLPNSSTNNNQLLRSGSLTGTEQNNFKWMLHDSGTKQPPFSNTFANCFGKPALTPTSGTSCVGGNNSTHPQFGFMHNFNTHSHLHHPYHNNHLNSPQSHTKNSSHFHYYCNQFNGPNNSSLCTNFYPMFNNYQLTHGSNDLNQYEMPGLQEETLLEKEHNETLAKLNFIVALVECIINLAESRANPVSVLTESTCKELPKDSYRKAEQLALYLRSLKLINSATNLSQAEISAGRLQLSTMVKNVLAQLTKLLKLCLSKCKQLCLNSALASASKKELESIVAEKLIYNYAIEMCQSAAVEELFGHPAECFAKYQTAQILLHSLSQQVINSEDKKLLNKYKEAVEKRLYVLQSQGVVYVLESSNLS